MTKGDPKTERWDQLEHGDTPSFRRHGADQDWRDTGKGPPEKLTDGDGEISIGLAGGFWNRLRGLFKGGKPT